jgi:hypothetical protein|tara:strand:- start:3 stop:437 length:435 start_codon:yes stop_codon:yes gene_type:complete
MRSEAGLLSTSFSSFGWSFRAELLRCVFGCFDGLGDAAGGMPATPRPRLLPLAPVVISDAFVFALALALGFALGFTFGFAFDFAFDLDGALAAAAAAAGSGGCRGGGGEGSGGGGGIAAEEEAILVARARRMCGADSAMPPRPP